MDEKPRKKEKPQSVMLKPATHERLDKYKAKVIGDKGTSKVTFDDIINSLLDSVEGDK